MIYLMRHGADPDNRFGGWSGYGLTETGRLELHRVKHKLSDKGITSIYSSDLKRAKETAEIVADSLSLDIIYLPQFREVNNGLLAGMEKSVAFENICTFDRNLWLVFLGVDFYNRSKYIPDENVFLLPIFCFKYKKIRYIIQKSRYTIDI